MPKAERSVPSRRKPWRYRTDVGYLELLLSTDVKNCSIKGLSLDRNFGKEKPVKIIGKKRCSEWKV